MGNISRKRSRQSPIDTEATLIYEDQSNGNIIKQIFDSCIMCLTPFGIDDERLPHRCINEQCYRLYCAQCVTAIRTHNGSIKRFRCMYCLMEYPRNEAPAPYQCLIEQLWRKTNMNYGIPYTRHLLLKTLRIHDMMDLWSDIECRYRHLNNLISTLERFSRWTQLHAVPTEAHILSENLLDLVTRLKDDPSNHLTTCQNEYRHLISLSPHEQDLGLYYIRLCERLLRDISDAEICRAFPMTHAKMIEWSCALASSDQFQPHIHDLITAAEHDLIDQWSNHRHGVIRAKIGLIGYTCVGKSTILNRILGVKDLTQTESSPVRSIKSTYYRLQFDRKEPLVSPDDQRNKTLVTLVDIQGHDKDVPIVDKQILPGNYLDEIRKADCDIYILVFDEKLRYEQHGWIAYIEQTLKRKCLLVRSKVDIDFLAKFRERSAMCWSSSSLEQRTYFTPIVLEQLRFDNQFQSDRIYLLAADYMPASADAEMLLREQTFDWSPFLDELGRLAFDARNHRIHALAMRAVAKVINLCFRRGYVLNVFNYKLGAGVAAIVPFGDQLPRYLARDHIRQAFGITKEFRDYLTQFRLSIDEGCLQTSTLENCVTATMIKSKKAEKGSFGAAVGGAFMASAPFTDDILRAAAPTAIVLTGAARIALTASTAVIGVVISGIVCAWSAVNSGKHIFDYVNRLCDDFILVSNPLIETIILTNAHNRQSNRSG